VPGAFRNLLFLGTFRGNAFLAALKPSHVVRLWGQM
jgi:hypothetical protein